MILSRLLYLASCFLAFSTSSQASITDCSKGTSIFEITELSLSPDPPVRGKDLYMIVKFNNPAGELSDGTATTSVSLNYVPFQPTVQPLCEATQCPLVSGQNDRSTSSVWPDTVSGLVSSKIEWTAIDGSQLLCIQIQAKIAAEKVKNLRVSEEYNQTHADSIAELLDLDDPVPANEFSKALSTYHGPDMCYPWEAPKELTIWTNVTNALLRSASSNTTKSRSN